MQEYRDNSESRREKLHAEIDKKWARKLAREKEIEEVGHRYMGQSAYLKALLRDLTPFFSYLLDLWINSDDRDRRRLA